jgi:hypothetical protein
VRCLIGKCRRRVSRWWSIDSGDGPFLTASCEVCGPIVRTSVLDSSGVTAVREIEYRDFLAAEVMESKPVLAGNILVGNGRVLYGPLP